MTKAKCHFNGVGQGLFYSASISDDNNNKFHFVYDCGTYYEKDKPLLSNKIKNFCKEKKEIDALFISHFHKDHISGIPELMKLCKIKRVFLPYFTEEELLLLRNNYAGELNNELNRFYSQPIDFFNGEVQQIFVVGSNRDGDNDNYPENRYNNKWHNTNKEWRPIESDLGEEDALEIDFKKSTSRIKKGKKKTSIIRCSNVDIKICQLNWHFKIYQDQDDNEQKRIIRTIKEEFRKLFGNDFSKECSDIFTNPNKTRFLKDTYNLVKYGINQSSLVLCHYPEEHSFLSISYDSFHDYYYRHYSDHFCYYSANIGYQCALRNNTATLLTGDINFNYLSNDKEKFKQFISQIPIHIGFFQLPHHGSRHNSSLETIIELNLLNTFMICSYGTSNRFKHPDPYLLYQLNGSCTHVFHVNEYENFTYEILK